MFKELNVIDMFTKPEGELVVPWAGRVIALGRKHLQLPKSLLSKHCLVNIHNTDDACFQYAMVCWKLGYHRPRGEGGVENPKDGRGIT